MRYIAVDTKKKTQHATARDTDDIQRPRHVYQEKMRQLETKDFVFVDDTGVNIAMTRRYGRAPKGVRVQGAAPVNKGKNVTVLGALSLPGITAAMTREGSTDTPVFLTFVQKILAPALRSGQMVIMDTLSSHKAEGVKEAIESVGATLEYLPSYSPD
jgi:DDE superfamily endonuclease